VVTVLARHTVAIEQQQEVTASQSNALIGVMVKSTVRQSATACIPAHYQAYYWRTTISLAREYIPVIGLGRGQQVATT